MTDIMIVDLDGTLVDSNYQHAVAWYRAFRAAGRGPELWRIHRAIGMGGDRLVAQVVDEQFERDHGDQVREEWTRQFDALIDEVAPLPGAVEFLRAVHARGLRVVVASSGKPSHVAHQMGLLDVDDLVAAVTDAEDAPASKPAPDLLQVALDKVGGGSAVVVGDSTWDFEAAGRLDLPGVALRTGGFSPEELRAAGAQAVYDSFPDLIAALDRSPLAGRGAVADAS